MSSWDNAFSGLSLTAWLMNQGRFRIMPPLWLLCHSSCRHHAWSSPIIWCLQCFLPGVAQSFAFLTKSHFVVAKLFDMFNALKYSDLAFFFWSSNGIWHLLARCATFFIRYEGGDLFNQHPCSSVGLDVCLLEECTLEVPMQSLVFTRDSPSMSRNPS